MASGSLTDLKPNLPGIDAVLSSSAVKAMLSQYAESVASMANANAQVPGAEYKAYVDMGTFVPIGKVACGNYRARIDNARHNTILKSR